MAPATTTSSARPGGPYTIGTGVSNSYDAPRMRYLASYTRPGELREIDPPPERTRCSSVPPLGDFDPRNYMERRVDYRARWRVNDSCFAGLASYHLQDSPMFITG